jgi:hypothetical protein
MKVAFFIAFLCFTGFVFSQNTCEMGFVSDSLYMPSENSYYMATGLVTPELRNGTFVKLFLHRNKYYLMIESKSNLYFDKSEMLEIKSGKKSMFQKDAKQYQKNKYTAFFVLEVYKNYIATLKEEGITSYVFSNNEIALNKQDTKEIKKIADCFYRTINVPATKN